MAYKIYNFTELLDFYENIHLDQEMPAIKTGYKPLDAIIKGFNTDELIILGARTGVGKTSFALNLVANAIKDGKKVLFVDLENKLRENSKRLVKIFGGDYTNFNTKDFKFPDQCPDLIYVSSTGLKLNDIRKIFEAVNPDFIIIDHLSRIIPENNHKEQYNKLVEVSSGLRNLSEAILGVPILILCQVNRGVMNRGSLKPTKADLKGCGDIEENADKILLLHREGYCTYNSPDIEPIEVIIDKNKSGKDGTSVFLEFNKAKCCISELPEKFRLNK